MQKYWKNIVAVFIILLAMPVCNGFGHLINTESNAGVYIGVLGVIACFVGVVWALATLMKLAETHFNQQENNK